jgi:hypothetical protein
VSALAEARAAKVALGRRLADEPLVNGVGVTRTDKGWAVKVNLVVAAPALDLPQELDGVPVLTEVVGPIEAS